MSDVRPIATFTKDPEAELDYTLDWTPWLASDTITSSTWAVDPDTITIEASSVSLSAKTTVWLSAGLDGKSYLVTNHIVTAGGREDDRTIRIKVRER